MNVADRLRKTIAVHEQTLADLRQALAELECEPPQRALSIKEAAFLIGVSTRSAYRMAPRVGVKIAGSWRIDPTRLASELAKSGERGQRRRTTPNATFIERTGND